MIVDHVWRPTHASGTRTVAERGLCDYLGRCKRPRSEHARGVKATQLAAEVRQP